MPRSVTQTQVAGGTNFVFDVTQANISPLASVADFTATINGVSVPPGNFVKLGNNTMQYVGPTLAANAVITINSLVNYPLNANVFNPLPYPTTSMLADYVWNGSTLATPDDSVNSNTFLVSTNGTGNTKASVVSNGLTFPGASAVDMTLPAGVSITSQQAGSLVFGVNNQSYPTGGFNVALGMGVVNLGTDANTAAQNGLGVAWLPNQNAAGVTTNGQSMSWCPYASGSAAFYAADTGLQLTTGPSVCVLVSNAATVPTMYVNGYKGIAAANAVTLTGGQATTTTFALTTAAATGGRLGAGASGIGILGRAQTNIVGRFTVYNASLTAIQALSATFNLFQLMNVSNRIIFDGDDLFAGMFLSNAQMGSAVPNLLLSSLGSSWCGVNPSLPKRTAATVNGSTNKNNNIAAKLNFLNKDVILLFAGAYDAFTNNGDNSAAIATSLNTYIGAMQGQGYKVAVITPFAQSQATYNGVASSQTTQTALNQALNNLANNIRGVTISSTSGVAGNAVTGALTNIPNVIIDLASDVNIGFPSISSNSAATPWTNTIYFTADGHNLTPAGCTYVVNNYILPAILSL